MGNFCVKKFYDALKERGVAAAPEIYYTESTASTNDWAKTLAEEGAPHGAICLADEQTEGRGRTGGWLSPKGKGVYASVILRPQTEASLGGELNISAGVAVAKAISTETFLKIRLKWPNDIVLDGEKIGGILAENKIAGDKIEFAVVGVGINISHTAEDLRDAVAYPASSLAMKGSADLSKEKILASVWQNLECEYRNWLKGGFEYLQAEWANLTAHSPGDVVFVKDETEKVIKGFYENIVPGGALRVKLEDGALRDVRYPLAR